MFKLTVQMALFNILLGETEILRSRIIINKHDETITLPAPERSRAPLTLGAHCDLG